MADIMQWGAPTAGHDLGDPVDNASFVIMIMSVEYEVDMETIKHRFPK